MAPIIKSIFSISMFFILTSLASASAIEKQESKKLLESNKGKYPGCVMIVKNQLEEIPDEQHNQLTHILLETCISGRNIGEKITKQKYEIPKNSKPRKLGDFTITIEPPGSETQDE